MEAVKNTVSLQGRIEDIINYQKRYEKLKEIEKVVLKSDLRDIDTIYTVYGWVEELCSNRPEIESFKYGTKL